MTTKTISLLPVLLAGCFLFFPSGAFALDLGSSGGPDEFGYTYSDSRPTFNGLPPAVPSHLGNAVAASGNLMVVGAPYDGSLGGSQIGIAYVYDLSSVTPSIPVLTLRNPTPAVFDQFGQAVAVSGTRVVIGSPGNPSGAAGVGHVYVYDLSSNTPTVPVIDLPTPNTILDRFGSGVGISGTTLVVGAGYNTSGGASKSGTAYVYDIGTGAAVLVHAIDNPNPAVDDHFGGSVAISGSRMVVGSDSDRGASNPGRAYVFDLASDTAPEVHKDILNGPAGPENSDFGGKVAISGLRVVVGGQGLNRAYVYDLDAVSALSTLRATLESDSVSLGRFSVSVAVFGTRVVVGADYESPNGLFGVGRAHVFDIPFEGADVTRLAILSNPTPGEYEEFGGAVAITDSRVLIAAPMDETGTYSAGSVFVYELPDTNPKFRINAPSIYPPTPEYLFIDLVALGSPTAANLMADDSGEALDIGFPFTFYDEENTTCYPSTNGIITFGQGNTSFVPTGIPNGAGGAVKNFIAPFWSRLSSGGANVTITGGGGTGATAFASIVNGEVSEVTILNPGSGYTSAPTVSISGTGGGAGATATAEVSGGVVTAINVTTPGSGYVPTGRVLYDTIGVAPKRIFIVQYEKFEYAGNPSKKLTFQVKLFEGSNAIEFHYKRLDEPSNATSQNKTIGIEDSAGLSGVQYFSGPVGNLATTIPTIPFAIRFERPIFSEVESRYLAPDGSTRPIALAGKLRPYAGRYPVRYESVQTFEAPEFIYLNKDFVELDEIGDIAGTQPDGSVDLDKVAYYRARNLGYAVDGEDVQGVDRFFERTITEDIKVIWKWELQFAVFVESVTDTGAPLPGDAVGNPLPVVGRSWVAKDTEFTASVDRTVGNDTLGLDISGFRYAARKYQLHRPGEAMVERDLGITGNRLSTEGVTISNWLRVRWIWSVQVRYRFDAAGGNAGVGSSAFLGQSYIRTYNFDNPLTTEVDESLTLRASTPTAPNPLFGNASFNEVWIDFGTRVEVGAFYRTFDRCSTLGDFPGAPSGNLGVLGSDVSNLVDVQLADDQGRLRFARAHVVDYARNGLGQIIRDAQGRFSGGASGPSEIHYYYEPTVFRAEIPLGESFDAANPNLQLVPALCDGGRLRTGDLGPSGNFTRVGEIADGTSTGAPVRWDQLGQRLLPVHPGNYQISWPDADDPSDSYIIEIVTGYPGDLVGLPSAREEPSGMRQNTAAPGAPPAYVFSTNLAPAADKFPASPGAHYRHHYDTNALRSPPTKLDLDDTDRWKFRELTFTDRTANAAVAGGDVTAPFSARGTGRSVLLYSYRPIPGQIADGTLPDENLAVRVVRSTPVAPILPGSIRNPLGRRGLELGVGPVENNGALGVISRDGAVHTVDPGPGFVLDFWLNTKDLSTSDGPVTILSTGSGELEVILDPASLTVTASYFALSAQRPVTRAGAGWSHYVIHVFGEDFFGTPVTLLDFYVDGLRDEDGLVTSLLEMFSPLHSAAFDADLTLGATSLQFGAGANPESRLRLDQIRLFSSPDSYLSAGDIRSLRELRTTNLRGQSPLVRFDFEGPPTDQGAGTYSFLNGGSEPAIGVGPYFENDPSGVWEGIWARLDVQEVATRLDSALDDGDFKGSGYILNAVSNYNANLYQRGAEVGTWGPVFPVNEKRLYTAPLRRLEVAYYENPFRRDKLSHPNVAWPYIEAAYDEVIYPTYGPHKDKAIYIASRVGTEGVDREGRLQDVFRLGDFANLTVYNQPDRDASGYNANEEHALVAGSNRPGLKIKELGEDLPNNPPLAAFALQNDINVTSGAGYTSEPWVLVQVDNVLTGEPEMAAYEVFKTRAGTIQFPRPADALVNTTSGLSYESAANPEDRFLLMDPDEAHDLSYAFSYPVAAGDLLRPPYPLNLVIGNSAMSDARGGNDSSQRTLWRDVNSNPWVVSGEGTFFYQYFYPFRGDFYLPGTPAGTPVAWVPDESSGGRAFTGNGASLQPGKVVYHSFWRSGYPKLKRGETLTYQGGEYFSEHPGSNGLPALVAMKAAEIVYDVSTPDMRILDSNVDSYSARIVRPLDRHEALFSVADMAAAGFSPAAPSISVVAERWYFKDLPGSLQKRFYFDSLAEKLVFRGYLNEKDSGDPDLTAGPDPLNILEPNLVTSDDLTLMLPLGTTGAWEAAVIAIHDKSQNPMMIRSEGAPNEALTGRYLSGVKESAITTQRIGLNIDLLAADADLAEEQARIDLLASELRNTERAWSIAVQDQSHPFSPFFSLFDGLIAFRPNPVGALANQIAVLREQLASRDTSIAEEAISKLGYEISQLPSATESRYSPLDSFGVGAALVPNTNLLTDPVDGSRYVTIVENNRSELDGAPVSLHIIEIIPDRYRGALKVIEGADAFSEKVTIQHNGDFGANTGDLYYEWWIRDAAPLGVINDPLDREVRGDGTLKETDLATGATLWVNYLPKSREEDNSLSPFEKHLGLHSIVFEGSPDVTLADKLILMRYRHKDESGWHLVPFEFTDAAAEWQPGSPAPFQWAGAANSPQLQASGEKVFIPQLVMGWVKRILDRINPYEARYTDFFGNESPATYSSQIQIAGAPFVGKVALNPDKNVIENVGLIELYETVLQRAKELSIENSSNPSGTPGINQALLLAATRLSVLYELLAREAYSDAQDSTIAVTDDDIDGLSSVASFTHAFQNMEADLLHEELALLRGTDFLKSYPVNNRLFWNYAKGLGEAAYNVNYNIYDANTDGFINEDDARILHPQGHGDAWGQYLSAIGMHYELLQQPIFSWASRSELYALMQNVLEVDFLDEKTFAKLAVGKARTGRDIVRGTYQLKYTQDPSGQWQGYSDVDEARAWGVSEWAHRAGQGAYFDWAVANAILPEEADGVSNPENLDLLERAAAADEIGEVAAGLLEIQTAMDEANNGVNPLGFDSDGIAFDIDPTFLDVDSTVQGETHFEQIYSRAVVAGNNAMESLAYATIINSKLRRVANDTESIIVEALRQDLDYRNRLIEIFGRPYDGTIGFGKVYPEGYEGPDVSLYAYMNRTTIAQIVPQTRDENDNSTVHFNNVYRRTKGAMDTFAMRSLYNQVWGGGSTQNLQESFETLIGDNDYELETFDEPLTAPYDTASKYGFLAPSDWGQRTSYGRTQRSLEQMLMAEVAVDQAVVDYIGFLQDWEVKTNRLLSELELFSETERLRNKIDEIRVLTNGLILEAETAIGIAQIVSNVTGSVAESVKEALPTSLGFSNDVTSVGRGIALAAAVAAREPINVANDVKEIAKRIAEFARDEAIIGYERDIVRAEQVSALEGLVEELVNLSGSDQPKRDTIGMAIQSLEISKQEYFTSLSEGFRLLREREAFNKVLAAKVQRNRYKDMVYRLSRNEAMGKYQSSFNHASRYVWLTAKAYDYETSLDPGHPAAATQLFDQIVKTRQLGLWTGGQPQIGQGGLAEILASLDGNFQVLEGQLGINSLQVANEEISLRAELFRIGPGLADGGTAESDVRWVDSLKARLVDDLWQVPEFKQHCRPFASRLDGAQPGMVIRFRSCIEPGLNFFGRSLVEGDHAYSSSSFTTKIATAGVFLDDYAGAGLATTPRAYLVPLGTDYLRVSTGGDSITRMWSVHDTRIPTPFVINQTNLTSPGFIPTLDGLDGRFFEPRRHADFRMYHIPDPDRNDNEQSTRLIGRSVWNSEWMLIIPGASLHGDPDYGLKQFAENISDLKLNLKTYSHNGQ